MANSTVSSSLRPPTRKREQSFQQRLKAARTALRQCQPEEALKHCDRVLQEPRLQATEQATVQFVRAEALEALARLTEAVQVLAVYEHVDVRESLPPELRGEACLRLGSAYGGTKDVPRALNYAKQALTLATQFDDTVATGKAHLLLGNLYRRVGRNLVRSRSFPSRPHSGLASGRQGLTRAGAKWLGDCSHHRRELDAGAHSL